MGIKVKVSIDKAKIAKLSAAQIGALELTAEALKTDVMSAAIVPKETGILEGSAFAVDNSKATRGKIKLVHDTPYARRLYFHPEYNFSQDTNTNAQGKWLDPWINGNKKNFARETYRKLFRRLSGGIVK